MRFNSSFYSQQDYEYIRGWEIANTAFTLYLSLTTLYELEQERKTKTKTKVFNPPTIMSNPNNRSGVNQSACFPWTSSNLPSIGFGTFNSFQDHDKVSDAVKLAIQSGYRLIDCASLYGNEEQVGRAINECIESGTVQRKDLCIVSKLWNTEHDPQDVLPACRRSLEVMGLEYFDIFMMHWPVHMEKTSKLISNKDGGEYELKIVHSGNRQALSKTYQAMECLVRQGLVKALGVSNFSSRQLSELLRDCTIPPVANEVEMHPLLQQPRLFDYCKEHKIQVIGYSPLGKIGYRSPNDPNMFEVPEILKIAEETDRTPAQVVLAWAVQRGASAIPKSLTPKRILSNLDVQDDFLTKEHMNTLNGLDQGYRYVRVPYYDFPDDAVDLSLTQPKAVELSKREQADNSVSLSKDNQIRVSLK
jgi:alcohol dehydrogenase (NADP+)